MAKLKIDFNLETVRKNLFAELVEEQTLRLIEYAPQILRKAYAESTFRDDTFNLADSYVWAVYYNGKLEGKGYLWKGDKADRPAKYHGIDVYGRQLATAFANLYKPQILKGWDLVVAATTPYAPILEAGSGSPRKRFEVISTVYDDLVQDFAGRGKVTKLNLDD